MKRGSFGTANVVTTAPAVYIGANPKRRALLISNNGGSSLQIAFGQTVGINTCIILPNGQRPWQFRYDDIGDLITQDVWMFTAGGTHIAWIATED